MLRCFALLKRGKNLMLELKNICFEADSENGKKQILDNISLKIEDGFVAITGPNGGGKSTLAKIIAGIYTPTSGQIILDGEDITSLSITERAKKGISFAFQQPVRFKGICVRDMLLLASKNVSENDLIKVLEEVGLQGEKYLDREIDSHLSGGEIKRIEIASVLLRNTDFIIFDEPEAGIDMWSFKELVDVFYKIKEKKNKTIIIISHQERIISMSDYIIILNNGEINQFGSKSEIYPILFCDTNCPFREKVSSK